MSILAIGGNRPPRPQSSVGYKHNIVDKDFYRLLSTEKNIEKSKQSKISRRKGTPSQQKYKNRTQILVEEYQNPSITKDKLYVIDKVVRLRALQGRYGVDHSEVLNFEFEQATKARQDHMNLLVYKDPNRDAAESYNTGSLIKSRSNALFERLTEKEIDEMRKSQMDSVYHQSQQGVRFNEWLRRKDAETRMRKKLIQEAKNDVRQEVFELAQQDQQGLDSRFKLMEQWATHKKLQEAQNLSDEQDFAKREALEQELEKEYASQRYRSFKDWIRKQGELDKKEELLRMLHRREQLMHRERQAKEKQSDSAPHHVQQRLQAEEIDSEGKTYIKAYQTEQKQQQKLQQSALQQQQYNSLRKKH